MSVQRNSFKASRYETVCRNAYFTVPLSRHLLVGLRYALHVPGKVEDLTELKNQVRRF